MNKIISLILILLIMASFVSCNKEIANKMSNTEHTCGAMNVHNPDLSYGTLTDHEGNVYKTITIGSQEWMAENLKVTSYRNGNPIPYYADDTAGTNWYNTTSGAYCNVGFSTSNTIDCPFGKLYNWYAVADSRKICPSGWHVPSDQEWTVLTNYLGGETIAGGKMKSIGFDYWKSPNTNANNKSGFSALPDGGRINGDISLFGVLGYWWSSTQKDTNFAWFRSISCDTSIIQRLEFLKMDGMTVRCIKD